GLDFPPVESLHVGVVTPNMGTGGVPVPTCSEPALGDDGILQTAGSTAAGCRSSYPSVLTFEPGAGGDPDAFARDVGCLATQGTNGCGFEQQLDAALKAVTPSSSPIRFVSGTTGHADGANAGFLREDALLGIVMVTDEDDCSAADPDLFNPRSTEYTGDLNLRCFQYPEALHPLARYADLVAGRDPDRVFFSLITGIPPEIEPAPGTPIDYAGILAHPDMQARIDPAEPIRLAPSCRDAAGMALAYPPVRLVQAARQLETTGATATLTSSCQDDFGGFVDGVLERLSEGVVSSCAP
ncbi:MAG TPA: hypothetical protein RMG45_20180, partial [Polyangiaceae bacterium LLY-WYZ-15_(1-7)]|nr:hypothetical protein [Polyangiaceae bacterium LLY-WYZ-15_(1-7)]